MGNTYSRIFIHLVFSTKQRAPVLKAKFEEELKTFILALAEKHELEIIAIGGTEDHLHVLLILPAKCPVSEAARIIKGGSSKWLNDHYFGNEKFRWQRGYGAFSIHKSLVPTTIQYIRNQEEHHKGTSYRNEFVAFLDKHDIDYDDKQSFS